MNHKELTDVFMNLEETLTAFPGAPRGPWAPGGPIRVLLLMGQP